MKVLILTGMSDFGNDTLNPVQIHFLSSIDCDEKDKVYCNFPYAFSGKEVRKVPLLQASFSNAYQYFIAKTDWIKQYRDNFIHITEDEEKIFVLSGSCGLHLLYHLNIPTHILSKLTIIAYGPVGKIPPANKVLLVQGHNDWISALWVKKPTHVICCGHMDYLSNKEFLKIVNTTITGQP